MDMLNNLGTDYRIFLLLHRNNESGIVDSID